MEFTDAEKMIFAAVFASKMKELNALADDIERGIAAASIADPLDGVGPVPHAPWHPLFAPLPWAGSRAAWIFIQAMVSARLAAEQGRIHAETYAAYSDGQTDPSVREQLAQIFGIDPPEE